MADKVIRFLGDPPSIGFKAVDLGDGTHALQVSDTAGVSPAASLPHALIQLTADEPAQVIAAPSGQVIRIRSLVATTNYRDDDTELTLTDGTGGTILFRHFAPIGYRPVDPYALTLDTALFAHLDADLPAGKRVNLEVEYFLETP